MAPVLLCPECGTKHPLDAITSTSSFPCSGCGRTLKVPAQAREMTAAAAASEASGSVPVSAPPPPAPAPTPHATQTFSAVPPAAAAAAVAPTPAPAPVPPPVSAPPAPAREPAVTHTASSVPALWVRLLLWIVAVPLAFLVVFGLARAFGFLDSNDVIHIGLTDGWSRYWPIVRLLPFVALATALFVTGGVYGIARLRAREQSPGGSSGSARGGTPKSRRPAPRQSARSSRSDAYGA